MSKIKLPKSITRLRVTAKRHGPEILTGIGIAGMITTTVLAVKATPKAYELLNERRYDLETEKLPAGEIVKTTWKCYIPAAVVGAMSVSCLVGASATSLKRNAALATAYKLSETALAEYKDKVVETIGEKKAKEVKEAIAKDKVEKNPVDTKEVIVTEKGDTLCYDGMFGRYFKSDRDSIEKAMNVVNRQIVTDMYASLNDFYDEIGIDQVYIGDELGWNVDDGQIEVEFSSQLAADGTPCLVVGYNVAPRYNYYSFV